MRAMKSVLIVTRMGYIGRRSGVAGKDQGLQSHQGTGKEKTSSSRKPLSLYEKHTIASVQAEGVCLLLK